MATSEFSVLFVCMGNICRSPSAHGMVRHHLQRRFAHLPVRLDSAGTHGYHIGDPPDQRSITAAARRGIVLDDLRARQVEVEDFQNFDLVLAMDLQNLHALRRLRPDNARAELRLFLDLAPELDVREVPDPYYGGANGFEHVLDLLEQASEGLMAELASRLTTRQG
ncbi:MAG: low molecular weight phosphotyrosine protein phosphatase [Gammaproteobacteria bacterium]|nr:low molecular weight phosphotyrosine protein phosphatase [Gammaproteobacteria bacterium]